MISQRVKELTDKFLLLARMFFLNEIKNKYDSIKSEKEWEEFIVAMLTIYMTPIIEFSEQIIIKTKQEAYNPIKHEKYALFIEETLARIYCELLDKLDITSNRGRMDSASGKTVPELIECTLEMEKLHREYRIKPPIMFPIKNMPEGQIQFYFPSKEKPIHLGIVKDKKMIEYFIKEIKLPKYQWVKRTSEKTEDLNEFTIQFPLDK